MVEGTVRVISNYILGALRNRRFLSLAELNEAIFERLETFNHKPFQKKDGSRASAFEEEKNRFFYRFQKGRLSCPSGRLLQ